MSLDLKKLLAYEIPKPRQEISRFDVALYALSIGFGHDPLNRHELDFVDPSRPIKVVPSMALVLAHPGFWLGEPESGVDSSGVLHADQQLELLAPIPADGLVRSQTRIVGLVDKGPGKAALLRTETVLESSSNGQFARLLRTTFLRGGGGFGGENEPAPQPLAMPERCPDHIVDLHTRQEQALLYRLNGDLNPLHSDPQHAKESGFSRPILHGLCTMGVICRALLKALANYDESRVSMVRLRFSNAVFPGETIRTEIWSDGSFRARVLERDLIVADEGRCIVI